MKIVERIVIVLLLLAIFGGAAWLYFYIQYYENQERDAIAQGEYRIPLETEVETSTSTDQSDWRRYYPTSIPLTIGSSTVRASVADSLDERIKGLSDTPYLPEGLVKLFVFGAEGSHSIWMKDMNYPLDIIWVTKEREVVHIEENVSPDTYPKSFGSPIPAWYVIEANAGFVEQEGVEIGDIVVVYISE